MFLQLINETAAFCDGNGIWYNLWEKEIAWIIVCIYALITVIFFLQRASNIKSKESYQKAIFRGYGLFVLGYFGSRVFFIFSDIERWNHCETTLFTQFVLFSYTVGIFSALSLLSMMEKNVLQFEKRIMTKIYFVFALSALVLALLASFIVEYLNTIRLINTIVSSFGAAVLMVIYFRMIFKATGDIRTQALLTFLGILFVFIGSIIDGELIIHLLNVPIWFPAIFPMIGFTIIIIVQQKYTKGLS